MKTLLIPTLAATLGLASAASAQVLMFDFGATTATGTSLTNSPYHTAAGGSFTQNTWNTVNLADVTSGLLFSNNDAATGVSLHLGRTIASVDANVIDLSSNPTSTLDPATAYPTNTGVYAGDSVGKDGIFGTTTTNPRIGVQIAGLSAGTYDIYVTARNTKTGNNQPAYDQIVYAGTSSVAGNFNFTSTGFISETLTYPTGSSSASAYTSAWVEGENYVKLSVSITAGELIDIAVAGGGTNRGFLNSIQIVNTTSQIPEPSSFAALAGLAGLGLAASRRRRA